ncbi:MAG: Invasion associated locus family protein [Hyphomicrobiales bacterium]|nr:Invasion associated locus family protein [Hyphomicrobiales bacterium]
MPISITRLGAAALAAGLMLTGVNAFAQSQRPTPPAQAPAQQAPAQQQQPSGPLRVELLPTQGEWTKICGKDQAANKEICYTTRDFGTAADQPPVLALAVYDVKGDDQRIVRLLLPVALMLRPGFRFSVDKGATQEGGFEICFPNGCFAESKVKGPTIDQMKKGTTLNISVKNQANNEVTFAIPMAGFGKAFDGAAIDPKVLEEQQKRLEAELQKRAEEQRKALESQQGAAAPK